jgi:hypothetical protein
MSENDEGEIGHQEDDNAEYGSKEEEKKRKQAQESFKAKPSVIAKVEEQKQE